MGRPQKRGLSRSFKDWLIKSYKGRCQYCNKEGADTLDHIIPMAKGGDRGALNITLACSDCNNEKGDKLDYVSKEKLEELIYAAEYCVVWLDLIKILKGHRNRKRRRS